MEWGKLSEEPSWEGGQSLALSWQRTGMEAPTGDRHSPLMVPDKIQDDQVSFDFRQTAAIFGISMFHALFGIYLY